MLNTKEEIEKWLNKYEVENFVINDDLTVDVNGSVDLFKNDLMELPFKFGIIKGDFLCANNQLKSLKNSPTEVYGIFDCSENNLTSLEHCTQKVGGNFCCSHNNLISVEYCPTEINGYFNCCNNQLTNLKYGPHRTNGDFICSGNRLTSLEYLPLKVRHLYCNNNNIKKESLSDFNSDVEYDLISDFGYKEDFLCEVKKQKSLKEKEKITKIINCTEDIQLIKKRL